MSKRPLPVTVVGWVFIAAGSVGLIYHAPEFKGFHPFDYELLWVSLVRAFAIVCGAFALRGRNWARWGLVAWMGYHVILSLLHTPVELVMHGLLLGLLVYFLFREKSSDYFRSSVAAGAEQSAL